MKRLKVLMLDLKSYYPSPAYQMGLMVAYAQKQPEVRNNVEFVFSEHSREQPAKQIAQAVMAANADLVAISNYAWNHKKICDTLDIIAASGAKPPRILLGGPNCSGKVGEAMLEQYAMVEALVEGEGEPAFQDICLNLVDSPTQDIFASARNCTVRGEDGAVIRADIGHRIASLDDIPSPYLTGILKPNPSPIFYETNRGCPYRCSFCYWGNGNSKVYRMSTERVKEEMEFFAENRVRAFWIADANFGIFPSDAEIAEAMAEINARHGYPFRSVGVNWAKNSSDRVLNIAEIFRKGKMVASTTIALQTVTAEAEKQSKRYSMTPVKFMSLLRSAEEKDIDTYTDIILGLPGESLDEFIDGLDTVLTTGVPSVKIHQLVLIPGTEFYDSKESFGLRIIPEVIEDDIPAEEKSDYFDCTVVSHPKMTVKELTRGRYFMGMVHMMHNHNLGQLVNLYLSRYGLTGRASLLFLEELLLGRPTGFPEEQHEQVLGELRQLFDYYANRLGVDDNQYVMALSFKLWFAQGEDGFRTNNAPALHAFMHDFYQALCDKHGCCQSEEERKLLHEIVAYNMLIGPKPSWRPEASYSFEYDVHTIAADLRNTVMNVTEALGPVKARAIEGENTWKDLPQLVQKNLQNLLTEAYLARHHRPTELSVKNPWGIPPSKNNLDWLLNSRSKHCVVQVEKSTQLVADGVPA